MMSTFYKSHMKRCSDTIYVMTYFFIYSLFIIIIMS